MANLSQVLTPSSLVTLSNSQTLTNKTISSGSNWSGNAIPIAYGGTGGSNSVTAITNLFGNTFTTASGGTLALTASSSYQHIITGNTSSTHTVVLPDATTLALGSSFSIVNESYFASITIQSFDASQLATIPVGSSCIFTCVNNTVNTASAWIKRFQYSSTTGSGSTQVLSSGATVSGFSINSSTIDSPIITNPTISGGGTFNLIANVVSNTESGFRVAGFSSNTAANQVGLLQVGEQSLSIQDKNIIAAFTDTKADWLQVVVQNKSASTSASADFIVNNNNTTGSGTYGDFGINSTAFTGTGSISLPNATYLYSNGGDLTIGTFTNNAVHFVVNNGATDAMTISTSGQVSLGTPLPFSSGGTGATSSGAANANINGFTSTTTNNTTTTLNNTSTVYQVFTGTSNQTVQLPSTATLIQGWSFHIVNNSTGTVTVQTSTATNLGSVPPGTTMMPTCVSTADNTGNSWEIGYTDFSTITGTGAAVLANTPTITHPVLAAGTAAAGDAALKFTSGTNLTNVEAGAVEYDGSVVYLTNNTTNGRGVVPSVNFYRLTAAGTGILGTATNFFGTNSNIPLLANATYEIEITAMALRGSTAGTVVWTFTNTAAPTGMFVEYEQSPLSGMPAPPGSTAALTNLFIRGATNTTLAAYTFTTGTLAASVTHYFRFRILLRNGTGTSLRIQLTAGTGNNAMTPQANSYWKCTRLPDANTGVFAA